MWSIIQCYTQSPCRPTESRVEGNCSGTRRSVGGHTMSAVGALVGVGWGWRRWRRHCVLCCPLTSWKVWRAKKLVNTFLHFCLYFWEIYHIFEDTKTFHKSYSKNSFVSGPVTSISAQGSGIWISLDGPVSRSFSLVFDWALWPILKRIFHSHLGVNPRALSVFIFGDI